MKRKIVSRGKLQRKPQEKKLQPPQLGSKKRSRVNYIPRILGIGSLVVVTLGIGAWIHKCNKRIKLEREQYLEKERERGVLLHNKKLSEIREFIEKELLFNVPELERGLDFQLYRKNKIKIFLEGAKGIQLMEELLAELEKNNANAEFEEYLNELENEVIDNHMLRKIYDFRSNEITDMIDLIDLENDMTFNTYSKGR